MQRRGARSSTDPNCNPPPPIRVLEGIGWRCAVHTRGNTLTGAGVTMAGKTPSRDADFSAYMQARQTEPDAHGVPADRRPAHGRGPRADRARQAVPVLGQGAAAATRSTPTSAGSWSTRTTRCGAAAGSSREHATDDVPETATSPTRTTRARSGALWDVVQTLPKKAARRRGAPLLRGAHRGRDRRRARHLRRDREVPGQPRAGHPARPRTPDLHPRTSEEER